MEVRSKVIPMTCLATRLSIVSRPILPIARTIADLEDSDSIQSQHVAEAIGYRLPDRRM